MTTIRQIIRVTKEEFFRRNICLTIYQLIHNDAGERASVMKPPEWELIDPECACTFPPTMTISMDEAQGLMDELYNAGLRPTEGAGSNGQLAAIKAHLEDMRSIALKLPPKPSA